MLMVLLLMLLFIGYFSGDENNYSYFALYLQIKADLIAPIDKNNSQMAVSEKCVMRYENKKKYFEYSHIVYTFVI